MSLLLLKRSAAHVLSCGVTEFLLIPDLPPEFLYGPMHNAIRLANLWRLRRGRPHVVASTDEKQLRGSLTPNDIAFALSLPRLPSRGGDPARSSRYVDVDDLSEFLPHYEEDFLLLFPVPPPQEIPPWPASVTDLDAVYVGQVDEFMKVQTVDQALVEVIQALPEFDTTSDPGMR